VELDTAPASQCLPSIPKLRDAILQTERVLIDDKPTSRPLPGDDIQLGYYADGYPKLPSGLDRRQVLDFAQAA
jgi:hypothetical protein